MHVPPFEMQVLEVFGALTGENGIYADPAFGNAAVAHEGDRAFGLGWSGARHKMNIPKINAALGRLGRKGLIERSDSYSVMGSWGYWRLTAEGRELLGFAPMSA